MTEILPELQVMGQTLVQTHFEMKEFPNPQADQPHGVSRGYFAKTVLRNVGLSSDGLSLIAYDVDF